mmetsp:Transcript_12829/g.36147  ORF Transcript_12829/g.36147 Transcript_12829/m.36147 type:complete len:200 (-) Transcript_12829:522-1121(-)
MKDRRLPEPEVPILFRAMQEAGGQQLEKARAELRIRIRHRDDNRRRVAPLGDHLLRELLESPGQIAGLARRVVRQVRRVVGHKYLLELSLKLLLQLLRFTGRVWLAELHGQDNTNTGRRQVALRDGGQGHRNDVQPLLVLREDDPVGDPAQRVRGVPAKGNRLEIHAHRVLHARHRQVAKDAHVHALVEDKCGRQNDEG